jgi:hypothetical protein
MTRKVISDVRPKTVLSLDPAERDGWTNLSSCMDASKAEPILPPRSRSPIRHRPIELLPPRDGAVDSRDGSGEVLLVELEVVRKVVFGPRAEEAFVGSVFVRQGGRTAGVDREENPGDSSELLKKGKKRIGQHRLASFPS